MHVLIVEDNKKMAGLLKKGLEEGSHSVTLCANKVPFEDIVYLPGHNPKSMTARYAEPDMDRLHEAVATPVRTDTKTDTKTDTPTVIAISTVKTA